MPFRKKNKKDAKKTIANLLKEIEESGQTILIDDAKRDEVRQLIGEEYVKVRSPFAKDLFLWMSYVPTKEELQKSLSDEFVSDSTAVSSVISAMVSAIKESNRTELTGGLLIQIIMLVTAILLRDKHPDESKIGFYRVINDKTANFDAIHHLFSSVEKTKEKGSDKDTKDKTYI